MFGKRKREDDDPLVPHGMIWHATRGLVSRDKEDLAPSVRKDGKLIEIVPTSPEPRSVTSHSGMPGRRGPLGSGPPLSLEALKRPTPGVFPPPVAPKAVSPFAKSISIARAPRRIDARLWRSMAMAVLSALLVLALISAVPHYATLSLPSRAVGVNTQTNNRRMGPVNAAAPRHEQDGQRGTTPKKETSRQKPKKAAAIQSKISSPKSAARRKVPSADEDYLAPDTYTYYGNKTKGPK